jgi:hypothetical protein
VKKKVKVTTDEMLEIKKLINIIRNDCFPMSERRISKFQYENIIKIAKNRIC